jgi:uncharacterized protein (TIRG00374 family)
MSEPTNSVLKRFRPGKILIPIAIGLISASYLLFKNFNVHAFDHVVWTNTSTVWILIAVLMLVVRDLAYMIRIRVLTDNKLSWRHSFDVIMLWEFASALVPPSLGGGFAFAIYILNKEKIDLGKSIAVILFTSFLDGIFLLVMAIFSYYVAGRAELFGNLNIQLPGFLKSIINTQSIEYTFWVIFFLMAFYKLLVAYALFINALSVGKLLNTIFSLPFLKRWKDDAAGTANELVIASRQLKGKSFVYWLKSLGSTFLSWTARFLLINFIVMAFNPELSSHLVLFCKQVVIGMLNIASPTPGGSGTSELLFSEFFKNELGNNLGLAAALAVLWRLLSYYPYLFVGAFVLPRWIKRNF